MGDGYKPAGGPGFKPGCATAAVIGAPLVFFATGGAALGHCVPDSTCIPGWGLIAGAILIAALCGLAVGAAVNRLRRRD